MAKFNSIEEINVWQESVDLALRVYKIINKNQKFCKDFRLRDQVQGSAISIPSNIAEGFERQTSSEFIRFLYIAKGSSGELRTQIFIAHKLGYISSEDFTIINSNCRKISSMVMNLIKSLSNKNDSL